MPADAAAPHFIASELHHPLPLLPPALKDGQTHEGNEEVPQRRLFLQADLPARVTRLLSRHQCLYSPRCRLCTSRAARLSRPFGLRRGATARELLDDSAKVGKVDRREAIQLRPPWLRAASFYP